MHPFCTGEISLALACVIIELIDPIGTHGILWHIYECTHLRTQMISLLCSFRIYNQMSFCLLRPMDLSALHMQTKQMKMKPACMWGMQVAALHKLVGFMAPKLLLQYGRPVIWRHSALGLLRYVVPWDVLHCFAA